MRHARIALVWTAILTFLASGMAPVSASTPEAESTPVHDPGPTFVFHPKGEMDGSYFTIEAEPGSTHTLTAYMGNVADEPVTLRTYSGDAFSLVNGGFGVHEEDEPATGIGTWLEWQADTYTFGPGEGLERTFTVNVPEDAAPGEYIAGLVLQTAEPVEIEGTAMFDQMVRRSMAVFIIVPGETTPGFELGTPQIENSVAGARVVVPVHNTGNTLVKPAGNLVLTDENGNEALRQQLGMGSVYAGMETTLEVPLPTALPDGDYEISLQLADAVTGAEASVEPVTLTLVQDVEEAPLEIISASVTPMPSGDDVQFAGVLVTVQNREMSVEGVQVVLTVQRDGQPVEDFVLASSVTLQQGETVIEQRYIPLDGWSAGEWTFEATIVSIDPQSGAEAVLLTAPVDGTITVDE